MGDPLQSFCTQRQKKQLMFNPIVRLEIESPYNGLYTQEQLNMRRKAEILEYKRDDFKTKQNTQKDDYVELIKGKQSDPYVQKVFYNRSETTLGAIVLDTYIYLPVNLYNCEQDVVTYTPSSNAGVPGNSVIVKDLSVPLYNYKEHRNYGILEPIYDYNLYVQSDHNIIVQSGINSEVLNFYTVNATSNRTQITELSIPIAWYIKGTLKSLENDSLSILAPDTTINVSRVNYNFKFNDNIIQRGTFSIPMSTDISFDISFVNISETNKEFQLQYYMGNIILEDLSFNSTSDFVYDFEINPVLTDVQAITIYNSAFDISFGIMVNPSIDLIETNVVLKTTNRTFLQDTKVNAKSNDSDIITSIRYLDDIGTRYNRYSNYKEMTTQTKDPIQKNLTSHIWMDVIYYNNERRIMFRNTVFRNGVYVVEDLNYDPTTTYYLQDGRYYIVNIEQSHPISVGEHTNPDVVLIYDNNNESVLSYDDVDQVQSTIYTSDNYTTIKDSVNYYWNSIVLDVSGNFVQASVICANHGYMGGQNIFNYGVGSNTPQQNIIPIPIVPEKDEAGNTGEITAEYRKYQLSQQYNTFQWE